PFFAPGTVRRKAGRVPAGAKKKGIPPGMPQGLRAPAAWAGARVRTIGARHGHIARNTPASGTLREPDSRHEPIRPHAGVRLPPGCLTPMARAGQFLDLSTSLLAAIQGIMARSLPPTCSICDSALMRRREGSVGAPAACSRVKVLAYSPG